MTFVIIGLIIYFIASLYSKDKVVRKEPTVPGETGIHPAEFELRDHFTVRCSEL